MSFTAYMIANWVSSWERSHLKVSLEKLVDLFDLISVGAHNKECTASKPQSNDAGNYQC